MPFYVSVRGLTTGPIPYEGMIFEMEFNFRDEGHALRIETSAGSTSFSERFVSKAAKSPGFSIAGPDVILILTPSRNNFV